MKQLTSIPSYSLHHHRLAGLPLIYSPQTKTPFYHRLQATFWRFFFASWSRLTVKHDKGLAARPGLMER